MMKKIALLFLMLWPLALPAQNFFLVDSLQLSLLREAVQTAGLPQAEAYQALKRRVDRQDLSIYGEEVNRYNRSYFAQEAAFLSLLAPSDSLRRHYAQLAFKGVRDIYEAEKQERLPHEGYGLSRAMMQLGLALPYAWSRRYWTSDQCQYLEAKIAEALDSWLTYEHANFGHSRGSNWVAVCRGGELFLQIAAGLQEARKERFRFLIEELGLHIQNGYGSLGASQEGLGYTEYGGQFLLKAVYAAADAGDSSLFVAARQRAWWRQAMYAQSFQPQERKYLMTGVAGSGAYHEGWASLLLRLAPREDLPYFLWWYDRHMGIKSPAPAEKKYDYQRAGTIWSILYYPLRAKSLDPSGVFPPAAADDHGYFFFRNRWQDENDILLSLMADEQHHSNAWDQPEVFALNLMAHNTRYAGGPGKERQDQLYSTLLVDGRYNIKKAVEYTGKTLDWSVDKTSGFVAIDGGALYQALGLQLAQRRLAVRFLPGNRAILCLMDTLNTDSLRHFSWQLNLGGNREGHDLQLSTKGGYFRLESPGGLVEAWVYGPDNFHFGKTEDPFQINFSGHQVQLTVILYLHQDKAGGITPVREGNSWRLAGQLIRYDPSSGRITIE